MSTVDVSRLAFMVSPALLEFGEGNGVVAVGVVLEDCNARRVLQHEKNKAQVRVAYIHLFALRADLCRNGGKEFPCTRPYRWCQMSPMRQAGMRTAAAGKIVFR